MRARELDDAARFRLARRERARADLFVVRRPQPREVAIEIDRVVAEEERRRNRLAVEVLDQAFGVDLVERAFVLDRALDEQAGKLHRLDQLAAWIFDSHRECEAVAVDVLRHPARLALVDARVARCRADRAARFQHALRTVGGDARHDVEQHVAHPIDDRLGQVETLGIEMRAQRVLRDRECDARASELGRVNVAVAPDGGANAVGLGPDRDEPDVATLGRPGQRGESNELRVGICPRAQLPGQLGVIQVGLTKTAG